METSLCSAWLVRVLRTHHIKGGKNGCLRSITDIIVCSFLFPTPGFLLQTVIMNEALTVFSSRGPFREKNLSIPAAAGSSPLMPLLVFWPLLAPRRRHCFSARALLVWCELYDMREKKKKN